MTMQSIQLILLAVTAFTIFMLLRIIRIQNMILNAYKLCEEYNDYNLIAPVTHPESAYQWFLPQLPSIRYMALSPRKVDLESWIESKDFKKMMECMKAIKQADQLLHSVEISTN